jgi:hypothetical protein
MWVENIHRRKWRAHPSVLHTSPLKDGFEVCPTLLSSLQSQTPPPEAILSAIVQSSWVRNKTEKEELEKD